jgi:3-keto-5-aminohexanoate cleavage enzyme
MSRIIIRKMTPADMVHVMDILKKWNMAPVPPSKETPDPERSTINIGNTFVAVSDDKLVGVGSYLEVDDEVAETASLAVDPLYKGKGIGFRLQVARLKEMKDRGYLRVRTETDRPETIQWYIRKFGYRKIGQNPKKHAFSLANVDLWTVLELDLDGFHE